MGITGHLVRGHHSQLLLLKSGTRNSHEDVSKRSFAWTSSEAYFWSMDPPSAICRNQSQNQQLSRELLRMLSLKSPLLWKVTLSSPNRLPTEQSIHSESIRNRVRSLSRNGGGRRWAEASACWRSERECAALPHWEAQSLAQRENQLHWIPTETLRRLFKTSQAQIQLWPQQNGSDGKRVWK